MAQTLPKVELSSPEADDPRIQKILDLIYQYASGNLNERLVPSDKDDAIDAVMVGLNMLAEELLSTTVAKEELEKANESLANAKTKMEEIQKAALLSAHDAGMAEIATGVLHNVGNILNSINVGAENIQQILSTFVLESFKQANALLQKNRSHISDFFSKDPRGEKLIDFYTKFEEALIVDFRDLQNEASELIGKIQLIKDVINLQQSQVRGVEFKEEVALEEAVENVLMMVNISLERHSVSIVKKFSKIPPVLAQRAKLIHILLNLFKNAKEAMLQNKEKEKILTIDIRDEGNDAIIRIADTGVGVSPENLSHIFSHGFTTKKDGHGFGLHYCANAITEMGGKIFVESDGENQGTAFSLCFKRTK